MVWGGMTANGRTQLQIINGNLTGVRYRDEILQTHVIPFVQNQARPITLQQDNARPHVARVARDFLQQQNVEVLPWPAVSLTCRPLNIYGTKWNVVYAISLTHQLRYRKWANH